MITEVPLDQYTFYIDYELIEEDFYQTHGIDWQCIGGYVTDENEEILDDSFEFMYSQAKLYDEWITKLIRKEVWR